MPWSFQSSSYSFVSTSTTSNLNGQRNTTSHARVTYSSPHGTQIYRRSQDPEQGLREHYVEYQGHGNTRRIREETHNGRTARARTADRAEQHVESRIPRIREIPDTEWEVEDVTDEVELEVEEGRAEDWQRAREQRERKRST
ncbi:hypothetical protein M011DRAFT_472586 [Sporormia fimetaria CBS 119925]|uniref:Uncharacterized protein n=1 Tax=Sporormia fimetaria CBS 119925 TaxID=1340428 RepID=A0A6A6UVY2_9PLEO|nr:hypothetical protein M011DRAFT_472586 [Sporormia fimetaria CBS 119925]